MEIPETLVPILPANENRKGNFYWETKRQGLILGITIQGKTVAKVRVLPDSENHWLRVLVAFQGTPQMMNVDGKCILMGTKKDILSQTEKYEVHQIIEILLNCDERWKGWEKYWIAEKHTMLFFHYTNLGLFPRSELLPHYFSKGNFECFGKTKSDAGAKHLVTN